MAISAAFLLTNLLAVYAYVKLKLNAKQRRLFLAALILKLCAGIGMGYIYKEYFGGGDSLLYFQEAQKIDSFSEKNDLSTFSFLYRESKSKELYDHLAFKDQPRALFFNKIVFVIYKLSWGNFWLISVYLSSIAFAGFWIFYRCMQRFFNFHESTLVISLFFWPSIIFWSSGLIKESISTFLILLIISLMLLITKGKKSLALNFFLLMISSYLLFKIKYYYAAILIPTLLTYYSGSLIKSKIDFVNKQIYFQLVLFIGLFSVLIFAVSHLHYNLRLENILGVMVTNYHLFEAKSDVGKMIEFPHLTADLLSFIYYSPKALLSGLFRPNIFDIRNVWSAIAGTENFVLLLLAFFQLKNLKKVKSKNFLLVLATLMYCSLAAIFLSFSSPNLGTLVRYKAGFLPVFLLLILYQNPLLNFWNKKSPED